MEGHQVGGTGKCPPWFSVMMNMAMQGSQGIPSDMMAQWSQPKTGQGCSQVECRSDPDNSKDSQSNTSKDVQNGNIHLLNEDITNGDSESKETKDKNGENVAKDDDNPQYWMWQAYQAFSQWQYCLQKANKASQGVPKSSNDKPSQSQHNISENGSSKNNESDRISSTLEEQSQPRISTVTELSPNLQARSPSHLKSCENSSNETLEKSADGNSTKFTAESDDKVQKEVESSAVDNEGDQDESMDISDGENVCIEGSSGESVENDQLWQTVFEGLYDSPVNEAKEDNDGATNSPRHSSTKVSENELSHDQNPKASPEMTGRPLTAMPTTAPDLSKPPPVPLLPPPPLASLPVVNDVSQSNFTPIPTVADAYVPNSNHSTLAFPPPPNPPWSMPPYHPSGMMIPTSMPPPPNAFFPPPRLPYIPYGVPPPPNQMHMPHCPPPPSAYHTPFPVTPSAMFTPTMHLQNPPMPFEVPNVDQHRVPQYSSENAVDRAMCTQSQMYPQVPASVGCEVQTPVSNLTQATSSASDRSENLVSGHQDARSFIKGRNPVIPTPHRNLALEKFQASDDRRQSQRSPNVNLESSFSTPASEILSSKSPDYFYKDIQSGNMIGKPALIKLEDDFYETIISRRATASEGRTPWKPLDRSEFEHRCCSHEHGSDTESSSDSETEGSDSSNNSSSSSEDEPSTCIKEEKKKCTKGKKATVNAAAQNSKKKKTGDGIKGFERLVLRTKRHRREVAHKMSHPYKLHPQLWYNERGELNDGPACACKKRHQLGPLHNKYEGEETIPLCNPESNNLDRLYHYKMYIFPTVNFISKTPTSIHHDGHDYNFDGFSIFSHYKLEKLPSCQVMRFNILYTLIGREEKPCENFTVRSLDMVTDYIFVELLEMMDVVWRADGADGGCRLFHLMPRFVRPLDNIGKRIEILSVDAILTHLLESAKPVFSDDDLAFYEQLDDKVWRKAIDHIRGTLVTYPGKKPAAIRVDQIDRRSLKDEGRGMTVECHHPMIVHISYIPVKFSLTRDPVYKKTMKNFLRMQYAMMNKVKVSQDDKNRLNTLAEKLDDFEHNRTQHRELTVEISSENMYQTGIRPDVSQHAFIVLCFLSHMRFHRGLSALEKRVNYNFKDKKLLHQALTHPSYRRTIFGTNQDHVQNSMLNCGFRYIDYGDRAKLFKEWRKRGLTHMIRVMSLMPSEMPVRSAIYGNERLEFLGDAVIEIISSVHLFYLFPNMSEGHLDAYRQALVQNHHLAKLAVRLGLHNHLLYTHGVDFCLDSTITHARSDAFEAFMAAVYLDGGLNEVDKIFASVLWCDDKDVLKVWCCPPPHVLQIQEPNGDRHWLEKGELLRNLTKLEDRLGIKFKHIRLLAKSLTLRQTGYNNFTYGDNQRLEFLGDSLLKFVTSDFLYSHFPQHHEGHLSLLKNSLVNKYTQSLVCSELGLHEFIIKAYGNKYPTTDKYRADILEAFIGSLFVDKDLKWVERFCEVCFWPRLVGFILKQDWNDPKSKLQQCCLTLRDLDEEPEIAQYRVLDYTGPTNQRRYRVGVYFKGKRLAAGIGRSVQQAQMDAARRALVLHHRYFPQLDFQKSIIQRKYGDTSVTQQIAPRKTPSRFDSETRIVSRWVKDGDRTTPTVTPPISPLKKRKRYLETSGEFESNEATRGRQMERDSFSRSPTPRRRKKNESPTRRRSQSPARNQRSSSSRKSSSPRRSSASREPPSPLHRRQPSGNRRSPSPELRKHPSSGRDSQSPGPKRDSPVPSYTGTLADLLVERKKKAAKKEKVKKKKKKNKSP